MYGCLEQNCPNIVPWLQAMSFGLTQYDVEELVAYCGGKCDCLHLAQERNSSAEPHKTLVLRAVSQREIEGLYKRFRALDRGHKAKLEPSNAGPACGLGPTLL